MLSKADRSFYKVVFLRFEELARAGFPLPGNARLRVSVRLRDDKVVCMAGIDDPACVLYCKGKAPLVQSKFLFSGGADGNPAGVLKAFIAKLKTGWPEKASEHALMKEIPVGLRIACAQLLNEAMSEVEAKLQAGAFAYARGEETAPRPGA